MKFKLLLSNGTAINQDTVINYKTGSKKLTTAKEICLFIKGLWKKETQSESFTAWAEYLNNSGEYEGTFTKYDALDNLCSQYQLNIDGKHVNLYDFFQANLPFKVA